jgi:hypothetical protein
VLISSSVHDRPRWWQWPTVLSLDAPIVSVTWQLLLARLAVVPLGPARVLVLGLSVWLAYVADRWLEATRLDGHRIRTTRHHFYYRHRRSIVIAWLIVIVTDVTMAFDALTSRELWLGAALLVMVIAYVISHQYLHRTRRWRAPKEICIAVLLTGGVWLFVSGAVDRELLAGPLAGFALLCFTNCALISTWEREVDIAHGQTSLALEAGGADALIRSLPWFVAMLALLEWTMGPVGARPAAACAFAGALALGAVDRMERRAGWQVARVLADVALLTPIVALIWPRA